MKKRQHNVVARVPHADPQRGSAFIMAIVVLAILVTTGMALLFLADSDTRMNQANVRDKRAFFIAEAGLEDARERLRTTNALSSDALHFSEELWTASGINLAFDASAASLKATYDANGNVTGFTGYGDDNPLRGFTPFGGGSYAAFLTNDAAENPGGEASLTDGNQRVMITAIGAGPNRSLKIVQAIVEKLSLPQPLAYITLPGPASAGVLKNFDGGNSGSTTFDGTDCAGVPGHTATGGYVPVVGTYGTAATVQAQDGVHQPDSFTSGPPPNNTGLNTIHDISGSVSRWNDCAYLHQLADDIRGTADGVCTTASPCSSTYWTATTNRSVTFVDGNWSPGNGPGKGLIWVTGVVNIGGNQSFEGTLLVIGQGQLHRSGGGNGHTYGAIVVARIVGPDGIWGTADDCSGGVEGFEAPDYDISSGGGTHKHIFCSEIVNASLGRLQDKVAQFRQY